MKNNMKKKISAFLALSLLASCSFAQGNSRAKLPMDDGISSKGFRVALVRPNLGIKSKIKVNCDQTAFPGIESFSNSDSSKPDSSLGASLGYASLPVRSLGWTTNLSMIESKTSGLDYSSTFNIVRIDGNLAYAFTSYVNIKGGLNVIKMTGNKEVEYLTAGLGFQASLGFQLQRNFGVDVGYTEMNTSGKQELKSGNQKIADFTVDAKISGVEIALTGTF